MHQLLPYLQSKWTYLKRWISLKNLLVSAFIFGFTLLVSSPKILSYQTKIETYITESIGLDNSAQPNVFDKDSESNRIQKTRTQYFAEGNITAYIASIVLPYFQYSRMSYIAAFLVFLIYLFYFRYIDIYEHEPWKYIFLTFLAGIVFGDFGLVLYDFTTVVFGWQINGQAISDFFYCILVIGGIEELVKIIPLIILLRFTKIINEPVDYIVYGGVAALGFAFSENIMYFDQHGAGIILGRSLTAVVLHTSLSGIVAYGFVLRDYRQKKLAPLKMYLIAIAFHGLYDFFLINPSARTFMILSYMILFISISTFNHIISNTLSNSPYYSKSIHFEVRKIQFLLIGGIIGIFVIQFMLLILTESFDSATSSIVSSLITLALLPALVMGFGNIELHPRKWKSLRMPFILKKIVIDREDYSLVDKHLQFTPLTRNRLMQAYFPNMGKVYEQSMDSKGRLWFYIRLEHLGKHPNFNNKHIVIRSKFGNELLNESQGIGMAGIYLINKRNNKPEFIGWTSVALMDSFKTSAS